MTELEETIMLANKTLDRIAADPDDDLAMLSRQFLRAREEIARLKGLLARAANTLEAHNRYGNEKLIAELRKAAE
jgi:hypothetical protein